MTLYIGLFLLAYLLGSIPTSVWVGKWFFGIDVRQHGSGNAGATNTVRILGWKAGGPVFAIDIAKGFAATSLAWATDIEPQTSEFVNFQLILGFAALLGHVFPVLAGFKGGKGVATLLGVVIALSPLPAGLAFLVFLVVLFIFKYVSVASMTAGISYPFMLWFLFPTLPLSLKIAGIVMSLALIITHKKNIARLINGEESKAYFLLGKKNK